jgi:hypothetical protein
MSPLVLPQIGCNEAVLFVEYRLTESANCELYRGFQCCNEQTTVCFLFSSLSLCRLDLPVFLALRRALAAAFNSSFLNALSTLSGGRRFLAKDFLVIANNGCTATAFSRGKSGSDCKDAKMRACSAPLETPYSAIFFPSIPE